MNDWKILAKDTLNVRDWEFSVKRFKGDPRIAASYLPLAQTLLGDTINRAKLGGIGYSSRIVKLSDGTVIKLTNTGITSIIDIDVTANVVVIEKSEWMPVYEFVATNMVPAINIHRWFILYASRSGNWKCESYSNHDSFKITPRLSSYPSLICYELGVSGTVICAPNKVNCITSYFLRNGLAAYLPRGGGDLHKATNAVGFYGNYQWEGSVPNLYWYGLVGRDGFLGIEDPIAETFYNRYYVGITAPGIVIVTRKSDGVIRRKELNIPNWAKSNELGRGYAWGSWKFDSTGLRAISVLHGNPYCYPAYNVGFDVTRILDDNEPNIISGAFKSGIYIVDISINESGTDFTVGATLSELSETSVQGVETAGLGVSDAEKNTRGIYYFAADFNKDDAPVYAYVDWEMRTVGTWKFSPPPCPPDNPYCDAVYVSGPPYPYNSSPASPICGVATGNRFGYCGNIVFDAEHSLVNGVYTETKLAHAELKFSNGLNSVVLRHSRLSRIINYGRGWRYYSGVYYYGSRSPGGSIIPGTFVFDSSKVLMNEVIETIINYARTGVWPGGDPYCLSVPGEAVRRIYGFLIDKIVDTWRFSTEYEDNISTQLYQLDLRGEVVSYISDVTSKNTVNGWYKSTSTGTDGIVYNTGTTTTTTAYFKSPILNNESHISTVVTPDPDPDTTGISDYIVLPPAGYVDKTDEFDYPLITRLWHHQVMGTRNPLTNDGLGPIGPFGDLPNYFPRQTFVNPSDTIVSHHAGHLATRFAQADVDFIKFTLKDKIFYLSHSKVIEYCVSLAEDRISAYIKDHPTKTREQAIDETGVITQEMYEQLISYVHRGEWLI